MDEIKSNYKQDVNNEKKEKKKSKASNADNLKIYASANFYKNPNVNSHKILKS